MNRSFTDLVQDYENDPTQWDIVKTEIKPSTNKRNRGGSSVQELLRHTNTGEELVRHTILKPDGSIFAAPHFRPYWK